MAKIIEQCQWLQARAAETCCSSQSVCGVAEVAGFLMPRIHSLQHGMDREAGGEADDHDQVYRWLEFPQVYGLASTPPMLDHFEGGLAVLKKSLIIVASCAGRRRVGGCAAIQHQAHAAADR
jgi:hypothetical protein